MENFILLVNSHHGVYIPKVFIELYKDKIYNTYELEDQIFSDLEDTENEFYWESWETLLDDAILNIDGVKYNLYHNEDLWAIPENEDIPENF